MMSILTTILQALLWLIAMIGAVGVLLLIFGFFVYFFGIDTWDE